MKYCKLEGCEHCVYSSWSEMYICSLTDEELFEDTECEQDLE